MTITKIALHEGTETAGVREIFKRLGVKTEVIRTPSQLRAAKFDGLMLLGGCDISTHYYGEDSKWAHTPDDNRDWIEWHLIRRAMTAGIPIFGICRGMQMITVAHGGSLYQDIYRQGATHDPSRYAPRYAGRRAGAPRGDRSCQLAAPSRRRAAHPMASKCWRGLPMASSRQFIKPACWASNGILNFYTSAIRAGLNCFSGSSMASRIDKLQRRRLYSPKTPAP